MAIAKKPEGCRGCPLDEIGVGFTQVEGTGSLGIMVVAEASGATEARESLPLRPFAQAGSVFEKACQRAGIARAQLAITNVVRCQPPNNDLEGTEYEIEAINHCSQYLDEAVRKYRPKALLGLGNVALRTLTGLTGPKLKVSSVRGYILESPRYKLPVVASLHPSYIRRNGMKLTEVMTYDLSLTRQVVEGKKALEDIGAMKYVVDPDQIYLEDLLDTWSQHPEDAIAFDIETAYSVKEMDESGIELASDTITQIQFSTCPQWAVVLPWNERTKEFATKVLALPNDKYSWNGELFDQRVLTKNGIAIAGRHIDGMVAWHCLQPDLPRGLQFVTSFYAPELGPWKHLTGVDDDFYGGRDVDSLMRVVPKILRDLEKRGVARGFWEHCLKLRPILDRMCERGLPVDREAQAALKAQLEGEMEGLYTEIQTLVPTELLKYKKVSGGRDYYKGVPPELKKLEGDDETLVFLAGQLGYCKIDREGEPRWAKLEGFNPSSAEQLKDYARMKGYRIPLAERANGEETETTSEKVVEEWAQKHDDSVCGKILEYKKREKVVSTYIEGFKGDENGRVHSTFTFTGSPKKGEGSGLKMPGGSTGQLTSINPNIQNIIKNGPLAQRVRALIKARPGHLIMEFDMKAFHAKTLGWLAKSPAYMRLSDLDIHSFVAAHLLQHQGELEVTKIKKKAREEVAPELLENLEIIAKDIEGLEFWLELSDVELAAKLKIIKTKYPLFRKKAKTVILAIGFGAGASKIYKLNKDCFASIAEANEIILLVRRLFPEIFRWQEETKEKAHRQSFLLSPHGTLRRFFEVKRWDPSYRRWTGGENAEEAIAFLPATSAFGEIKDRMILLEEMGALEKYQLINTIHDSLVFECPIDLVGECAFVVKGVLESESKVMVDRVMGAFACGADVQIGKDWGSLEEFKFS